MGLCSALEECSYDKVWVMSCDMPLVNWDTAQELEHYLTDGIDAVIPVDRNGKKYVLCAWYRKSTLEILKEQLESGDLKVKHLLGRLRVCYVAVEGLSDGSHKFQISIPGRNIRRLQDNQTVYPTENPAASLPGQQSDRIKNCTQIFRLYLLLHIPAPVRRHFWRD